MKKSILLIVAFVLVAILVIGELVVAFAPEVFGEDLKILLKGLNPIYLGTFLALFIGILVVTKAGLAFSFIRKFGKGTQVNKQAGFNIPWSLEAKQRLKVASNAVAQADLHTALKVLYEFNAESLKEPLTLLSNRLAKNQKESIAGILFTEEERVEINRLANDILSFINLLEAGFSEKEAQNRKIRESLREGYQERLKQKMASRFPVKLRVWMSQEGTSELIASTFKTYPEGKIPEEIGQFFQDAHGRLLIIGQPGMGKTTLLLELADRLFDLEADSLPVLVNLATWKSGYIKLDTWLEEVFASELSTNNSGAKAVLQQSNLILLLDGLDELKKESEMSSCLAAIAEYGATAGRRFVITCRIEEYKAVQHDARVNMQIEVGPLEATELIVELEKTGYEQPEAKALAQALRNDELLREVVKTQFYFNSLQLLYASRTPKFITYDLKSREFEIQQKFIEYALSTTKSKAYQAANAEHWLSFLAKRMTERNKVVFELVDLQYNWLLNATFFEVYFGWVIEGLIRNFVMMLLYGLSMGVFAVVGLHERLASVLKNGLGFGIAILLTYGLFYKFIVRAVTKRSYPEILTRDQFGMPIQVFFQRRKKDLIMIFVASLILGLITKSSYQPMLLLVMTFPTMWLVDIFLLDTSIPFVQIKRPYQRFIASMRQVHFSILQHWHLRYLLFNKGLLPWNLVWFLNEMAKHNILETDGATWRFRHRIIQEYFAAKWNEEEETMVNAKQIN